jgi:hypothetical protein
MKITIKREDQLFFERYLEEAAYKVFTEENPPLVHNIIFPTVNLNQPGLKSYTYKQYTQVGMAKLIANHSKDIPMSTNYVKEFTTKVYAGASKYSYNVRDIQAASRANERGDPINISTIEMNAALQAILQLESRIAFVGDDDHLIVGFFNHPNVPRQEADDVGVGNSTEWADKTPQQILADMDAALNGPAYATKGIEKPNVLLLPLSAHQTAMNTYLGTTENLITILKKNRAPLSLEVYPIVDLETAGIGGTRRMVAYNRNENNLQFILVSLPQTTGPEINGLDWTYTMWEDIAGVKLFKPLSVQFIDGF